MIAEPLHEQRNQTIAPDRWRDEACGHTRGRTALDDHGGLGRRCDDFAGPAVEISDHECLKPGPGHRHRIGRPILLAVRASDTGHRAGPPLMRLRDQQRVTLDGTSRGRSVHIAAPGTDGNARSPSAPDVCRSGTRITKAQIDTTHHDATTHRTALRFLLEPAQSAKAAARQRASSSRRSGIRCADVGVALWSAPRAPSTAFFGDTEVEGLTFQSPVSLLTWPRGRPVTSACS